MAEGEELIELKFRMFDGTDIGHSTYAPSTTVATLKQKLVAEWPKGQLYVSVYFSLFLILRSISRTLKLNVMYLCTQGTCACELIDPFLDLITV